MHTYRHIIRSVVLLTLLGALALPVAARAGVGVSTRCSVPVVTEHVTIALDLEPDRVRLCYSTTEPGNDTDLPLIGGAVEVTLDEPGISCRSDRDPTLTEVTCRLRDRDPGTLGRTLDMRIREQGQIIDVTLGIEGTDLTVVACVRDVLISGIFGTVGPTDVGLCA